MATDEPDTGRPVSTRRDFLRNSAVAGGVAWAAPTVLSLGPNAFATTGGSPRCYRFRYEVSAPPTATKPAVAARYDCSDSPGWGGCEPIEDWATYPCVMVDNSNVYPDPPTARIPDGFILVDEDPDGSVTFTLPPDCVYEIVEAKAGGKAGTPDKPGTLDCSEIVEPDGPSNSFTVTMGGSPDGKVRAVSHVDVVFCCS